MPDTDKLDLKIILAITNAYQDLYEKGEITEQQLEAILSLIDQYQDYEPEDFAARVKNIFGP